jgi:hypothetical protein
VGFRLSKYLQGGISVASPQDCPNVHTDMKQICATVQQFLTTSSLPVYDMVRQSLEITFVIELFAQISFSAAV